MSRASAASPGPSSGPGSGAAFDPHRVPVFPRLAMEISTRDRTITIAGKPSHAEPDEDLIDAAVAAAAGHVQAMKLDHVRAVALVDGDRFNLVIGADGQRYNLDVIDPRHRSGRPRTAAAPPRISTARKPVWPILAAAAAVMLISTTVGVGLAWQQRQQLAAQPVAPSTPPPAELPIVPTDAWTTRATWTIPVAQTPQRAQIVLTDTTLVALTANDTITAVDPATGITQWTSPVPGGNVDTGPVLTSIDNQSAIAVVTDDALIWWPTTGAAKPAGQIELDSTEDVTFTGDSPLITGRGQLARIVEAGRPVERTIPAGAQAVRADGSTVFALNTLGQYWLLDTTDTYVPEARRLTGVPAKQPITYLGTAGQLVAIQIPGPESQPGQIRLYRPSGTPVGDPLPGAARTLEASPHGPWIVLGQHLIDSRDPANRATLPEGWRTARLESRLYGQTAGTLTRFAPATQQTINESNPDALPPIASNPAHAYYVAANNDGQPQLYAVTPATR